MSSLIDKLREEQETEAVVKEADSGIRERLNVAPPGSDEWFSILIHADPGVGKTHFCGTAGGDERTGPVLVIDCEGGTEPLRKWPGVDTKRVRSMDDLKKVFDELAKFNQGWYKTVALDSLSEIQDVDMRMVMQQAKETAKNPDSVNIDVPSPREWGIGRNHVRIIVRAFRDLPTNLIVTTMCNETQREGKPDRYEVALPGKLKYEIPGFMGIVGWYHFNDNKQTERIMQVKGSIRVMAKTRFKELGEIIMNPTVPMIYDLIHNKQEDAGS
ncbi:MAG TPA: AAA family ATPase [Nitrososphaera sp.]|jgi:hypothetical protein